MAILFYDKTVYDTNSTTINLTGNKNTLVRYFSDAYVYIFPDSTSGTVSMDSFVLQNGGVRIYNNKGTFYGVESADFTFSCEDSYGSAASTTFHAPMVEYVMLTCNAGSNRPDASGNMTVDCTGAYFNGNFGARYNTLSVQYRYRVSGGSWSGWTTMSTSLNGNAYYAYSTLSGLDYQTSYDFEFMATDALMSVSSSASGVKSTPVFHWGENDVVFEVPVTFNGGVNGGFESGTWTPTLDSYVSYYSQQYGWYTKIGNVVTIGFTVWAQCNSGGHLIVPYVYGIPYEASAPAAGGGVMNGAYMEANEAFQGFVLDGSIILPVAAACDSVAGTNVAYSSNHIGYPRDGGTIIMSGTITYMV